MKKLVNTSDTVSVYTRSYKQPVCKQPVLDIWNHKQLSLLNIVSISNHLNIKIKKKWEKDESKQFHWKNNLMMSIFSA